ncbi:addiction module toxin, RelE/StbE family [Nitrosococcus halophilus Nc 4]|uniref:Addiction module toxin, RelE/StbE family n=1 Tax=Nitrosococcus halophilus (strain Nc4) TaxID=472759 RepID=D5BY16_NITHN|nr:type II toxin-antitoxin system RelE/ParE family toxin [Nitrosococcus halophilus]ADE15927.1 addiction module toxin, RelE/StbE family [Nitrosococcus halophilus Nc 4]
MRVVWSPQARRDLREIYLYIAEDDPHAARVLQERIKACVTLLTENRSLGRPGRVPGTRELIVPRMPYLLPYRGVKERLEILRVYHGAWQWPETFDQCHERHGVDRTP